MLHVYGPWDGRSSVAVTVVSLKEAVDVTLRQALSTYIDLPMRSILFTNSKSFLLTISYRLFQNCESFRIPFNHLRRRNYRTTSTIGFVHDLRSLPHHKQRSIFVLNDSTENGSDEQESSTELWKLFQRLYRVFNYPVRKLKSLLQRFVFSKLDRTVDSSSFLTTEKESPSLPFAFSCSTSTDRSVFSAPHVNLTGSWNIIVSNKFLNEYDLYLRNLGQPYIVRSVAISIVDRTTEETIQTDGGRSLLLRSINARGVWERTLIASCISHVDDGHNSTFNASTPICTTVLTADKERVLAEAWWERNGTVHHSWLRGATKYGGGDFESVRYLVDNGSILVCNSTFHPDNNQRYPTQIQWRFRRHC